MGGKFDSSLGQNLDLLPLLDGKLALQSAARRYTKSCIKL